MIFVGVERISYVYWIYYNLHAIQEHKIKVAHLRDTQYQN